MMRWLRGTPIDVNYDFRRWRKHQVEQPGPSAGDESSR